MKGSVGGLPVGILSVLSHYIYIYRRITFERKTYRDRVEISGKPCSQKSGLKNHTNERIFQVMTRFDQFMFL